ncbi:transposase [Blautia wexlerae]|uniref:Transposase n=1 Tax=Blautia wexlerae TaxID=418240 RepID=A0A6L8XYL4_9FIRM|nr:transposase [Blautia wexlerae]HBZ0259800.1 transposase [Clostridioides difficile]MZS94856.1 transposase [Blautia wexlerae]MZS98632.1 transposase [Blautia wexlerae]MZT02196.1 transposase [Blautia wexlerae]
MGSECKESAGKKMSTRIRKGNKYLKATLVDCARARIRNKQSYLYFTTLERITTPLSIKKR